MKKNIIKALVCFSVFSMMFATTAFASGGFDSTYWIQSTGGRPGVLYGASRFNLSHNNMTVTVTVSNISHTAGNLNVILQRNGILGFSSVGSSQSFNTNRSRNLTAGNSGTYRLRMWNQNATGINQGRISVTSSR